MLLAMELSTDSDQLLYLINWQRLRSPTQLGGGDQGNDWLRRDITATLQHERQNNAPIFYFTKYNTPMEAFIFQKVRYSLYSRRFILM